MKSFKKIVCLFLCALMIFPLYACNSSQNPDNTEEISSENTPDNTSSATESNSDGNTPSDQTSSTHTENTTEAPDETTQKSEDENVMNILFLGNSLMYYNDMPELFAKLAQSGGKKVNVRSVTKGSATMSDFASPDTEMGKKMRAMLTTEQKWDYIVVEPSRRITPHENTVLNAELASAKELKAIADSVGAEILLYSVWGNNTGSLTVYEAKTPVNIVKINDMPITRKAHSAFMRETSSAISESLGGARIADAGYAFENFIAANPDINLYDPDERHPSAQGSYLAACVFYSLIFGEKSEGLTFSFNLDCALTLQKTADATVLEKLIPDLSEPDDGIFKLLVIGSNLLDDYDMLGVLKKIGKAADGKEIQTTLLRHKTFVCNMLADESTDLGMRATLAADEWDAIVIQISRRCTVSGTDVEANELRALETVLPLLKAETSSIFLLTLNSDANPKIFTTAGGDPNYTATGSKESTNAAQGTQYFYELAVRFAAKLDCGIIDYGSAYIENSNGKSDAILGYLQGCMLYNAVFGHPVPEDCTETNTLSADLAAKLREIAKNHSMK